MGARCRTLLGTLLATATLHAVAGNLAIRGGVGAYYGVPLARGMYDPLFSCTYWCGDPFQLRLELERQRRMEELRERATQPEPRIYGPVYGTWGLQRYIRRLHPKPTSSPHTAARASCGPSTNTRAGHTTSPSLVGSYLRASRSDIPCSALSVVASCYYFGSSTANASILS